MHLNLFTQCSPSPQWAGLWRHPEDRTAKGYRSLRYWTELALRLEASCFDAIFFGDSSGIFDVYQASAAPAIRNAVQVPAISPVLVLPAVAAVTRHLGFAVTYSTTHHPPFECARTFSSLDHLTEGRVAWNIVTSFLRSAAADGIGEDLPHDLRYDRADEYIDVVRGLWEQSWSEDAVTCDSQRNVFSDPARVRPIQHSGRWFQVQGPHQCEPSPQRTPVLYQAGASRRGIEFAARHAEVVFMTLPDARSCAAQVTSLRHGAEKYGRAPENIKVLHGTPVLIGRTREETKQKADCIARLISPEGEFAKWCGWTGFDMAAYPDDALVSEIRSEASRSVLRFLQQASPGRPWSVGDLRSFLSLGWRPRRRSTLFGTPEEVADQMEEWMKLAGIDGFNLLPCPPSSGIDDICDLLIPELQRRGVFRKAYKPDEPTLRERYFGAGRRHYRT